MYDFDTDLDIFTAECDTHGVTVARECNTCGMDTCSACRDCEWCG